MKTSSPVRFQSLAAHKRRSSLLLSSVLSVLSVVNLSAQEPAPESVQPMAECEVLARVNDEVILASDLSWEAQFMLEQRLAKVPPETLRKFRLIKSSNCGSRLCRTT